MKQSESEGRRRAKREARRFRVKTYCDPGSEEWGRKQLDWDALGGVAEMNDDGDDLGFHADFAEREDYRERISKGILTKEDVMLAHERDY